MAHILIFIHWFVLVFTFGNVELVTIDNSKSNDFSIEELNGYTLRGIFEDGNLNSNMGQPFININRFNGRGYSLNVESENLKATVTELVLSTYIQNAYINIVSGNRYYMNTSLNAKYANTTRFRIASQVDGVTLQNKIIPNTFSHLSDIITATSNNTNGEIVFYHFTNSSYILGDSIYFEYFNVINITTLGLEALTTQQMDYWFNVYQENEQREISETYDYIENELTTNDLIYIVLFALLWGLAIKIVKGVM